jgi:hypothetical protein
LTKQGLGDFFGDFFTNSSGHPACSLALSLSANKHGIRRSRREKKVSPEQSGTDVMIFKIFSPKKSAKNWRF